MVQLTGARRLLAVAPHPSVDRLVELDRLRRGAIHRPAAVTVVPGGKGFNVARVAATLGAPVTAVGLLGGHTGHWMEEALAAERLDLKAVWHASETRTCTSILDRTDQTMTEIYESGPPITVADWSALMDAIRVNLTDTDIGLVTVSGSLPPGAPDDALAQIVDAARSVGQPVAIDSHGPQLIAALEAHPWLVKVNLDEASEALAYDPSAALLTAADAVRSLVSAGAEHAVVTTGPSGSVAGLEDGSLVHFHSSVRGRYAVGCGDALLGGLAVAVLRGEGLRTAVILGTAAAAASALSPGVGRLEPELVERLLDGVVAEPSR